MLRDRFIHNKELSKVARKLKRETLYFTAVFDTITDKYKKFHIIMCACRSNLGVLKIETAIHFFNILLLTAIKLR